MKKGFLSGNKKEKKKKNVEKENEIEQIKIDPK